MIVAIVVIIVVLVWSVVYMGSGDPKPPEEE